MNEKKEKEEIRQQLLERRGQIPEETYLQKSRCICSNVSELPAFKKAEAIHCYVSMNGRREVNTHPLIEQMLAGGKKVIVPITQFDSGTLRHINLQSISDLEENEWGVLEPVAGPEISADALELVIVPMAGGDRQRNRIGYGKGFYDRFLAQVDCPTAGLLFENCLMDEIPAEPFDIPLTFLVTENEIIG